MKGASLETFLVRMYPTHGVNMDSIIINNLIFISKWSMYMLHHFCIPRIQKLHVERGKKNVEKKLEREMGGMWSYFSEYLHEIPKNNDSRWYIDNRSTNVSLHYLTYMDHITTATTKQTKYWLKRETVAYRDVKVQRTRRFSIQWELTPHGRCLMCVLTYWGGRTRVPKLPQALIHKSEYLPHDQNTYTRLQLFYYIGYILSRINLGWCRYSKQSFYGRITLLIRMKCPFTPWLVIWHQKTTDHRRAMLSLLTSTHSSPLKPFWNWDALSTLSTTFLWSSYAMCKLTAHF